MWCQQAAPCRPSPLNTQEGSLPRGHPVLYTICAKLWHLLPALCAGRQSPQLTFLDLNFRNIMDRTDMLSDIHLERIAECCPALGELDVTARIKSHVPLTALRQLTSLTALRVTGVDDLSVLDLAQLTRLQDLQVNDGGDCAEEGEHDTSLSRDAIYCLTTLTALTELSCNGNGKNAVLLRKVGTALQKRSFAGVSNFESTGLQ